MVGFLMNEKLDATFDLNRRYWDEAFEKGFDSKLYQRKLQIDSEGSKRSQSIAYNIWKIRNSVFGDLPQNPILDMLGEAYTIGFKHGAEFIERGK